MCGIYFSCSDDGFDLPTDELLRLLDKRGPDSHRSFSRVDVQKCNPSTSSSNQAYLNLTATVLALRGSKVVEQPLQDGERGSMLCWNGEAWKINGEQVAGNDAQKVFDLLQNQPCRTSEANEDAAAADLPLTHVRAVLCSISGPFSFVFYDVPSQRVYFGRDRLGRRSLLLQRRPRAIVLSSVADASLGSTWDEVNATGFFYFDIHPSQSGASVRKDIQEKSSFLLEFVPWSVSEANRPHDISSRGSPNRGMESFPSLNRGAELFARISLAMDSPPISQLYTHLRSSISSRVNELPIPPGADLSDPRIAVLFSGGLDCTLIARILHDILPLQYAVDLINVAFENPRVLAAAIDRRSTIAEGHRTAESAYGSCPDRVTGVSSFEELKEVCPKRSWRLIAVDIPYVEMKAHREKVISLMYPHDSEMDLSIALALYFAARGTGTSLHTTSENTHGSTTARVFLSGLGADELFAGYTRHRIAFERHGHNGLLDELELDFNRLGQRNLGRDDRVTAHWGRELRYPYLDEELVSWALELPVWQKCSFGAPPHVLEAEPGTLLDPAKHLLRLLAWTLGMKRVAQERKRAIQFGARSAKMETGRSKGTSRICAMDS